MPISKISRVNQQNPESKWQAVTYRANSLALSYCAHGSKTCVSEHMVLREPRLV